MAEQAPSAGTQETGFKARLKGSEPLLGTFVKSTVPQNVEILASVGFDFIVLDQEHASFDRETIDLLLLAARARRIPALVRVADLREIGHALDCDAAGVIAPHVTSVEEAREVVAACRYEKGRRGYSNSPRAGDYGRISMTEHVRAQDHSVVIIVMIEDEAAVAQADAILAVEHVDAIFVGCADLAVSMHEEALNAPRVQDAVARVSRSAAAAGRRVLAPASSVAAASWLQKLGISALVVSSDQGLLRAGATSAHTHFFADPPAASKRTE